MSKEFTEHKERARVTITSVKMILPFMIIEVYYRTSIYAVFHLSPIQIASYVKIKRSTNYPINKKGLTFVKPFLVAGSGVEPETFGL